EWAWLAGGKRAGGAWGSATLREPLRMGNRDISPTRSASVFLQFLCLNMIRPRVKSYGETSIRTRSPARTRMRNRRMLPPSVVRTVWVSFTATRNVALGSTSVTVPSSSMASCFDTFAPAARLNRAPPGAREPESRRARFPLARLARLLVIPLLAQVLEHARANHFPLELLEHDVQPVVFANHDFNHDPSRIEGFANQKKGPGLHKVHPRSPSGASRPPRHPSSETTARATALQPDLPQ